MSECSYTPEQSEAILLAAAEYHSAVAALRRVTGTGQHWQTVAGRVGICQARLLTVARDPETTPAWASETPTSTPLTQPISRGVPIRSVRVHRVSDTETDV